MKLSQKDIEISRQLSGRVIGPAREIRKILEEYYDSNLIAKIEIVLDGSNGQKNAFYNIKIDGDSSPTKEYFHFTFEFFNGISGLYPHIQKQLHRMGIRIRGDENEEKKLYLVTGPTDKLILAIKEVDSLGYVWLINILKPGTHTWTLDGGLVDVNQTVERPLSPDEAITVI